VTPVAAILRDEIEKKLRGLQQESEELTDEQKKNQNELQKDLEQIAGRDALRQAHAPLDFGQKPMAGSADRGRFLFTVKGCLACHTHQAVETASGKPGSETYLPSVVSEANFGPDLSQVAAKLGTSAGGGQSARIWLAQWIKDPHVHSPRSRMPVTHMSDQEAADIAEWLLSQQPGHLGSGWNNDKFWGNDKLKIAPPAVGTLKSLARV